MDLNYLLHRHQISLDRARNAAGREARQVHATLAKNYAQRIAALRKGMIPADKEPATLAPEIEHGAARA